MPGVTAIVQSYVYDELNRLKTAQEVGSSGWTEQFSYDRFGNRNGLTVSDNLESPLPTLAPEVDTSNNRYKVLNPQSQATGYDYDLAGNLIQEPEPGATLKKYTYDAENHLIQAKRKQGTTETFISSYDYDADGRRVKTTVGSVRTINVYNIAGELIAEYSDGQVTSSGTSYVTSDMLGTTRVVTGADAQVKERHDYLPYGEEIPAIYSSRASLVGYGIDALRQKFTSKERDNETGLDYFGARYYASVPGRFTSPDPFSIIQMRQSAPSDTKTHSAFMQFIGDPRRWNRFAYAVNSPLVFTDKTGLDIMIIENHATNGNPIGHTAIAITGRGVYSMGNADAERQQDRNNNILGGGVRDYLERETPRRDTTLIIIKTTAAQDAAAEAALVDIAKTRPMLQSDVNLAADNCSTRVNEALDAAGIAQVGNPAIPGSAGSRLKTEGSDTPGKLTVISIPQNSTGFLMSDLKAIQQFEPKPKPANIRPPGSLGGTPVITMPMKTKRPEEL